MGVADPVAIRITVFGVGPKLSLTRVRQAVAIDVRILGIIEAVAIGIGGTGRIKRSSIVSIHDAIVIVIRVDAIGDSVVVVITFDGRIHANFIVDAVFIGCADVGDDADREGVLACGTWPPRNPDIIGTPGGLHGNRLTADDRVVIEDLQDAFGVLRALVLHGHVDPDVLSGDGHGRDQDDIRILHGQVIVCG